MSVNYFMVLTPYGAGSVGYGPALKTESAIVAGFIDIGTGRAIADNTLLPLGDFSVDVDQTLSFGTGGFAAGKIEFNPLRITKRMDILTPTLFQMCAAGTPLGKVDVLVARTNGSTGSTSLFAQYTFKLAAVATLAYAPSGDGTGPQEIVTFGYGDMQIRYRQQFANGSYDNVLNSGWNAIKNVADTGTQFV